MSAESQFIQCKSCCCVSSHSADNNYLTCYLLSLRCNHWGATSDHYITVHCTCPHGTNLPIRTAADLRGTHPTDGWSLLLLPLKEKHAAATISSTREKWDIVFPECFFFRLYEANPEQVVLADTTHWHHPRKHLSKGGGERRCCGWGREKEWGHLECISGCICTQQLGLFMIWLRDCSSVWKSGVWLC